MTQLGSVFSGVISFSVDVKALTRAPLKETVLRSEETTRDRGSHFIGPREIGNDSARYIDSCFQPPDVSLRFLKPLLLIFFLLFTSASVLSGLSIYPLSCFEGSMMCFTWTKCMHMNPHIAGYHVNYAKLKFDTNK
jgi:hypothetical protein